MASNNQFLILVFIVLVAEKSCSTEAVITGRLSRQDNSFTILGNVKDFFHRYHILANDDEVVITTILYFCTMQSALYTYYIGVGTFVFGGGNIIALEGKLTLVSLQIKP